MLKKIPKKHQPKGLTILYEDHEIIVVNKIEGLLTIGTERERQKTVQSRLNNYVKKGNKQSRNRVFIVHRLDRDTSGILIFAKNENAKRYLQENWKKFNKKYVTVVHGKLQDNEGILTSYLVENKIYRMYSVKDPNKGKYSKTGYKVIKESQRFSLLEINLFTGRKHQIRVHLSEKGHPVVGDKIYGADKVTKRLALHAISLKILHPSTHEKMSFETKIPLFLKSLVKL
ncbi:MAG: RluA family pseudouridine synthase [Candidatus Cloacimonetes bacterium]|nr:RluA family pseudouridine synthase [Candidatus Cloacimonadota bacterium]MBT7469349.1 RluA family pseudouridine synthase [Candidatus Cloacimonadota bacterium]